jgi:triosephosphate isomerase
MRRALVVGNWKMNPDRQTDAVALALAVADGLADLEAEIVLCPPAIWLPAVHAAVGDRMSLGAQTVNPAPRGAFTGEVSATMLEGFARFVIVGHSERRAAGESDDLVARQAASVQAHGMTPIVAVGETADQRAAGETLRIVSRQLGTVLDALSAGSGPLVVAYEPVWAIGSGIPARGADAQAVASAVRAELAARAPSLADDTRILYGGSVTATNATEFFRQTDIDGALVGGASLDAETFIALARAAG